MTDIEIDTCPVCHEPVHASESDDEGRCQSCTPHPVHDDTDSRTPMQRYEDATGPDGWLTVWGWERLAEDLETAADRIVYLPMLAAKMADRAADCRDRANALRAA